MDISALSTEKIRQYLTVLNHVIIKNQVDFLFDSILFIWLEIEQVLATIPLIETSMRQVISDFAKLIEFCDHVRIDETVKDNFLGCETFAINLINNMIDSLNGLDEAIAEEKFTLGHSTSNNSLTEFYESRTPAPISTSNRGRRVSDIFFQPILTIEENSLARPIQPNLSDQHMDIDNGCDLEPIYMSMDQLNLNLVSDDESESIYMSMEGISGKLAQLKSEFQCYVARQVDPGTPYTEIDEGDEYRFNFDIHYQVEDIFDASKKLVFKHDRDSDKEIVSAGEIDHLIVYAIDNSQDKDFRQVFLNTYRSFIVPSNILTKLIARIRARSDDNKNMASQTAANSTISFLQKVVENLNDIDVSIGGEPVKNLLANILKDYVYPMVAIGELRKSKSLREQILILLGVNQKISNQHTWLISNSSQSFLCFDYKKIAEQFTILDSKIFSNIKISEILNFAVQKDKKWFPNVAICIDHFNRMGFWIKSEIFKKNEVSNPKYVEKKIMLFCKVLGHLIQMSNFNSALAVYLALDSPEIQAIYRRKDENFLKSKEIFGTARNYQKYRSILLVTSAPCLPYLGVILKDLIYINAWYKNFISPGVVNFSKCWVQNYIVENSIKRFRNENYSLQPDGDLLSYLNNFENHMTDEELKMVSKVFLSINHVETSA